MIQALLDFVIDETGALSKTIYESAFQEYTEVGRGAFVVFLNKKHMCNSQQFAMIYQPRKRLETLECKTLLAFVDKYDPLTEFVLFPVFVDGRDTYNKPAILHRDAYQTATEVKDKNGATIQAKPPMQTSTERCNFCLAMNKKLLRCSKCLLTAYCSRECQVKDWTDHKPMCNILIDAGFFKA